MKYLTLMRTVALVHQHQRPVKTAEIGGVRVEYIEVTSGDIAVANRLAAEILGRTLDELPPETRKLLGLVARDGDDAEREGGDRQRRTTASAGGTCGKRRSGDTRS